MFLFFPLTDVQQRRHIQAPLSCRRGDVTANMADLVRVDLFGDYYYVKRFKEV